MNIPELRGRSAHALSLARLREIVARCKGPWIVRHYLNCALEARLARVEPPFNEGDEVRLQASQEVRQVQYLFYEGGEWTAAFAGDNPAYRYPARYYRKAADPPPLSRAA